MLIGAAIVPTAPLLVPGLSASLPDGVAPVCDAVDAALESLPEADVAVLVAAGDSVTRSFGGQEEAQVVGGLYDTAVASLAGIGRPDVRVEAAVLAPAVTAITGVTQYPRLYAQGLPLDLAVLVVLLGDGPPLVPMAVPTGAAYESLVATGAGVAQALEVAGLRAVMLAAGDCAAGLDERSPLHRVAGARDWDDQVTAVVDSGRLDGLSRLGPAEADRVGARGWAPMCVLHGACARSKLGIVVRHYSAPRGVGYLVAQGR